MLRRATWFKSFLATTSDACLPILRHLRSTRLKGHLFHTVTSPVVQPASLDLMVPISKVMARLVRQGLCHLESEIKSSLSQTRVTFR